MKQKTYKKEKQKYHGNKRLQGKKFGDG